MLAALIEHRKKVRAAKEEGKTPPRVPEYIGQCIFLISTRLSNKPNFSGYPFKEDMIADGYENAIQYLDNFNPDKYDNPFAYFTMVIYRAFVRRIEREKKYLYTKYKIKEYHNIFSGSDETIEDSEGAEAYENDFVKTYEENKEKKKNKKRDQQAE